MKAFEQINLIELVEIYIHSEKYNLSNLYNVKNYLKATYPDKIVFTVMTYLRGEFTRDEEVIFLDLHKHI